MPLVDTPHSNIIDTRNEFYQQNGYLLVEDAYSKEEVEELKCETIKICAGEYGKLPGLIARAKGESDNDVMRRHLCVHFPHKISKAMSNSFTNPATLSTLTTIIGPNVKCMQSMLFIKASGKPGQAWHQDEFYIPTRDRSLTGGWLALDDATTENGCLWVIPGSHKHGILWRQEWHGDKRFDCSGQAVEFPYTDSDAIPVPVKAGSMVFFNGYLLHRSLPNLATSGFRRALVNHYMSAESLLPWMGTDDYRDIVMIAGRDPYSYKGTVELAKAHVRPSGEGGCGSNSYNDGLASD